MFTWGGGDGPGVKGSEKGTTARGCSARNAHRASTTSASSTSRTPPPAWWREGVRAGEAYSDGKEGES